MKGRRVDIVIVIAAFLLLGATPLYRYWPVRTCEAHGEKLQRGWVPIRYGLIERSAKPYWLFPNARHWRTGGCAPGLPVTAVVRYCATCREAEAAWDTKHPKGLPFKETREVRKRWTQWRKQHPEYSW
jgi:hypothetical protein